MLISPYICVVIIKTDIIMKTEKIYSWVLKISNSLTGEVEYRSYLLFTTTEIEREAATIVLNNSDLCVAIFKLHKKYY